MLLGISGNPGSVVGFDVSGDSSVDSEVMIVVRFELV